MFNNDGEIVATLSSSATDVKPGQTVTAEFYGFDPYKPGKFPSTFQKRPLGYLRPIDWKRCSSRLGTARAIAVIALYCAEGIE